MKLNFIKYIIAGLLLGPVSQAYPQFQSQQEGTVITPQTWSFMKYGNDPVNLYTGSVSVSIPVYTYHDNDFELPVSLTYASGGYAANCQTGIVGRGWFLNVGGTITRQIMGMPDEDRTMPPRNINGYYYYHKNVTVDKSLSLLRRGGQYAFNGDIDEPFVYYATPYNSASSKYETEPDEFLFSFAGYKGKFQFDINRNIQVYNVENGSHADFQVESTDFDKSGLSSFTIRTNDGYKYVFGGNGDMYDREWNSETNTPKQTVVSWQLTEIVAPNGRKVTFIYRKGDAATRGLVRSVRPNTAYFGSNGSSISNPAFSPALSTTNTFPAYLDRIVIGNSCQISFGYSEKEAETVGYSFRSTTLLPRLLKLSSIDVDRLPASGQKRVRCNLSYEYAMGNPVMFLKKVDLGEGEVYELDYNGLSDRQFPPNGIFGLDHWGYYNGHPAATADAFIPKTADATQAKEVIIGHVRDADEKSSLLGMLSRIKYPTGGYSEYEYEGHHFSRKASDIHSFVEFATPELITPETLVGGARIKRITNYSGGKKSTQREFVYQKKDGSSSGILLSMPRYRIEFQTVVTNMRTYRYRGFARSLPATSLDETHVGYSRVLEKTSELASIEYEFSDYETYYDRYPNLGPSAVGAYIQNVEIVSSNAWTVRNLLSVPLSRAMSRGRLLFKRYQNTRQNIRIEEYQYLSLDMNPPIRNIKPAGDVYYECKTNVSDAPLLSKKTVKMYVRRPAIITEETYEYNGSYKLTKTAKKVNNGRIFSERRQYLEDMGVLTEGERRMKDAFQTRQPVKTVRTIQESAQSKEYVLSGEYAVFSTYGSLARLEAVKETELKSPVLWEGFNLDFTFSKVHNDRYDSKGYLTQQTDEQGLTTVYVWGYNHLYLMATVVNATLAEVEEVLGDVEKFADALVPDAGKIDNLRKALSRAQVVSYAYVPLVGVVGVTDARGVSVYYEYDAAGRLSCVKGNDKKVVSRYDYHYAVGTGLNKVEH